MGDFLCCDAMDGSSVDELEFMRRIATKGVVGSTPT